MSSLLLDSVDAVVLQSIPSSEPLETQIRKCVLGECVCVRVDVEIKHTMKFIFRT